MLEDEKKLIKGAKQGNTQDFDKLYLHYVPAIYRFIYMKVMSRQEAEDLTHEVFLSAWQNIYRYKARGFPLSSWLYQIARNRVIDYYRLRKDNLSLDNIGPDSELVKVINPIELELDKSFALEKIRLIIKKLGSYEQDVLLMRFVEDLSHREIASVLEKSEGAVRVIQHRALIELKRLLNGEKNAKQKND